MAGGVARRARNVGRAGAGAATDDPAWVRRLLIGTAVGFLGLLLLAPLTLVFLQAFEHGWPRSSCR
jgi:ABC-type sulfate transport system permease subunit